LTIHRAQLDDTPKGINW